MKVVYKAFVFIPYHTKSKNLNIRDILIKQNEGEGYFNFGF